MTDSTDTMGMNLPEWVFASIAALNPTPILITDRDGVIVYINDEFTQVTGYNREEVIGKKPSLLKSGEHDHVFYGELWETIRSGNKWIGEICNKKKTGALYWEKEIIAPLQNPSGETEYYLSIRIDDMDRRRADTLQHIKELAGGVAHEFSQPLQVLTIMTSLLEMNPERLDYVEKLQTSVKKISNLVNALKNITELKKRDYFSGQILDLTGSSNPQEHDKKETALLLVDDENELRRVLSDGLELEGFTCYDAETADQALKMMKLKDIKLIVSDINMPGVNGLDLYKQIRNNGYMGKFLFMTGYAVEDWMQAIVSEADGIIYKPFQLSELVSQIQRILAS